jgi:hypothetical protein
VNAAVAAESPAKVPEFLDLADSITCDLRPGNVTRTDGFGQVQITSTRENSLTPGKVR